MSTDTRQERQQRRPPPIRLLDVTFKTPEENLAYDEILLDRAETGKGGDVLRFWESPVNFVVLGVSQVVREHVHERACEEHHIPVLRRCSAGGCVLQGPGCLNFTLILTHEQHPDVATIRGSYCYILGRIGDALKKHGLAAAHKGTSDIAIGGRKISGNAQKRRRRAILHHGTLLYAMKPEVMELYLREPVDRPKYRGTRTHRGFVNSIPLIPTQLKEAVRDAFDVPQKLSKPSRAELNAVHSIVKEKYRTRAWNYRR